MRDRHRFFSLLLISGLLMLFVLAWLVGEWQREAVGRAELLLKKTVDLNEDMHKTLTTTHQSLYSLHTDWYAKMLQLLKQTRALQTTQQELVTRLEQVESKGCPSP